MLTKQQILDSAFGVLVQLRAGHPAGLRGIGSANAYEVFTRHGLNSQTAQVCQVIVEFLEDEGDGIQNPMELVELLADQLKADGSPTNSTGLELEIILPGQRDPATGLASHPDLLFTATNHNRQRYGITADASATGGLPEYQDWCDDYTAIPHRLLSVWDAQAAKFILNNSKSN
jgi:hypothetical protein